MVEEDVSPIQQPARRTHVDDVSPVGRRLDPSPSLHSRAGQGSPTSTRELEKLIQDTHELLEQEGLVNQVVGGPTGELSEDLVAELERDIEELVRRAGRQPVHQLDQLETELGDLINKGIYLN